MLQQVTVSNVKTGKTVTADVLTKTKTHLRVAIVGTPIVVDLYKEDINDRSYIGFAHGMEFLSNGKTI